jgi:hypothetical protein
MKDRTQAMRLMAVALSGLLLALPMGAAAKGKPGPGSDPATIYILYGGVDGEGAVKGHVSCDNKLNADTRILGCNHYGGFFFQGPISAFLSAYSSCFPNVDEESGYTDGTIQLIQYQDLSAEAVFRFWGRDEKDANDVLYVLRAFAGGWDGPFPPEWEGGATTMISDSWSLSAENKRQQKDAGDCLTLFPQQSSGGFIEVGVSRLTP